jgi:O-antigen ligase
MLSLHGFLLFLAGSIAFAQICLSLLFLTYIVEAVITKQFFIPRTPVNQPIIGYAGVLLITTMFSPDVLTSIRGLKGLLTIGVFYLFYLSIQDFRQLKKFTMLLVLYVTLAALYGIVQHYLEVDLFRLSKPISLLKHVDNDLKAPIRIPGFSSYMTFSGHLAMTLPIICAYFLWVKKRIKKGLLAISIILTCVALLWTYTRSAWIGAVCAVTLLGYLRGKKFSFFFFLLFVFLAVFVFQPAIFDRSLSVFSTKENMERLYTWESTLNMIKDHPLTGIGKGNYSKFAPDYRSKYNFDFSSRAHAHNNLLQAAVEGGIPSLLCFLWLWGVIFRSMYRTYQQISENNTILKLLSLGFLGSITAFFVQGFFENNFGDSETVMMMWLITAFALKIRDFTVIAHESHE